MIKENKDKKKQRIYISEINISLSLFHQIDFSTLILSWFFGGGKIMLLLSF